MGLIYIVRNDVNDYVYIGQTTQALHERMLQHKRNKRKEGKFHDAMREIGFEHFYAEVLEDDVPSEELNRKEREYIEKFNSVEHGYNSLRGGKGEVLGDEIKDVVIEEYNSGLSTFEIAKKHNTNQWNVWRCLKRNKVKIRHDGNKYEQFGDEEFISMWNDPNIMRKEMAEYYHVDSRTIKRHAKRLNLNRKV